jgi:predicted nucleic acid-binding protein
MIVLADSSVWVDHFKRPNEHLELLLADGNILCHPYIVGEVSCGTPPRRRAFIDFLSNLEALPIATHQEVLATIEAHQLFGRGCGYVDISLLSSILISERALIWTFDKPLEKVAATLGKAYKRKLQS